MLEFLDDKLTSWGLSENIEFVSFWALSGPQTPGPYAISRLGLVCMFVPPVANPCPPPHVTSVQQPCPKPKYNVLYPPKLPTQLPTLFHDKGSGGTVNHRAQ